MFGMPDERDTQQLKVQQIETVEQARRLAGEATEEEEFAAHKRRAEKADYLREKLEERERSERDVES